MKVARDLVAVFALRDRYRRDRAAVVRAPPMAGRDMLIAHFLKPLYLPRRIALPERMRKLESNGSRVNPRKIRYSRAGHFFLVGIERTHRRRALVAVEAEAMVIAVPSTRLG